MDNRHVYLFTLYFQIVDDDWAARIQGGSVPLFTFKVPSCVMFFFRPENKLIFFEKLISITLFFRTF